ncbi:hypothetical protein [Curtobacterium sp. MCBA15_001]|uniref:hypothetical protein n=1 Tax=Curtobacterium sp. MCBA15_001 TaxID=1898731 RepID=UPI0015871D1A|nr:hypothetical protein [Curtobacterium sp. MCBA15_001]
MITTRLVFVAERLLVSFFTETEALSTPGSASSELSASVGVCTPEMPLAQDARRTKLIISPVIAATRFMFLLTLRQIIGDRQIASERLRNR